MAAKSASLTINVIANAAKARSGFKDAEKSALNLKGEFDGLSKKMLGKVGLAAGFTAIAGFAMKSVEQFTQLAKATHDLGLQTGLGTEQASRWLAVADDMEIGAEQLAAAFKQINKDIDADKWSKYGVATKNASGEARTANDIFLDVLDTLGKIDDPTERARAGTELLGKAWGGLAPLVGKSREEYERMLASVEAGQVITAQEYQQAERMRLAQDALADAWGEVALSVGEFVAGIAPAVKGMADFLNYVNIFASQDISPQLKDMSGQLLVAGDDLWGVADAFDGMLVASINGRSDLEKTADAFKDFDTVKAEAAQKSFNAALAEDPRLALDMAQRLQQFIAMASDPNAADGLKQQVIDMGLSKEIVDAWVISAQGMVVKNDEINEKLKEQNDLVDGLTQAWEDYLGVLDMKSVADDAKNALLELTYAIDDPKRATDEFAAAQKAAAEEVARFISEAETLDKDIQLQMLADLQSGDLAAVYAEIEEYQRLNPVTIPVDVQLRSSAFSSFFDSLTQSGGGGGGGERKTRAAGGPVTGGTTYLVGEEGPELFTPPAGGTIIPNGAFAMSGGGGGVQNITINMPAGANGAEVLRALQQEARRTGQLALPVSSKTVR